MRLGITRHPIRNLLAAGVLLSTLLLAGWLLLKDSSRAADIRNFDPGNIMSDVVMSDKNTMSVQEIQSFLNSKNYCDNRNTHMAAWYPHLQYNIKDGKFVCMAREDFSGKSAAQLIWEVGQEFSINPQVLIVLLEKEQGLVSDTWPNHVQYRTATGYGCPDTAPCEAQYFGLENQLKLAAKLFREVLNGGWSNYPVGPRYVQYHPNAACGGSIVNIQNRATSALYRYTPYQPNQSALSAGYGTGDDCGAYGNRNFWRLFTDWFGNTQSSPRFEEMETPRYLTPSRGSVRKINITTYQETDMPLVEGQLVYFTGRIFYNGEWCLRTRFDRDNNNAYCVPLSQLKDASIDYIPVARTKIKVINSNAIKINPLTESILDVLRSGQILSASQRFTFNGTDYYRSIHDSDSRLEYGIKASDVQIIDTIVTPIPDIDLSVRSRDNPRKMEIWSHREATSLRSLHFGQTITFSGTVDIDGTLYYISKLDYSSQDSIYAISSEHLNQQAYSRVYPVKTMKVSKRTCKINLDINQATNLCYSPGTELSVDAMTRLDSGSWYRTTWETAYNTNLVINPEDLSPL